MAYKHLDSLKLDIFFDANENLMKGNIAPRLLVMYNLMNLRACEIFFSLIEQ